MFFFERVTSRPAQRNIDSQETPFLVSSNYGVQNIQMEHTFLGGADMLFVFLPRYITSA